MKVRSKIGVSWAFILCFLALCTCIVFSIALHQSDIALDAIEIAVILIVDIVMLWATFDTWYVLNDDEIEIHSAFFCHKKINYYNIRHVDVDRSVNAKVALSKDHLNISFLRADHKLETITISPNHKEVFLQELRAKARI